jgi:UDP-N-acetylmuramoylalanine--D-glutamate ligase
LLVERAGKSVAVAGNIGPTLLDTAGEPPGRRHAARGLGASSCPASSSRACSGFEPTAATVLNVTQDHLDWHGEHGRPMLRPRPVFGQQGLMVLNRDDPLVMAMLPAPVRARFKGGRWSSAAAW